MPRPPHYGQTQILNPEIRAQRGVIRAGQSLYIWVDAANAHQYGVTDPRVPPDEDLALEPYDRDEPMSEREILRAYLVALAMVD